MNVNNCSVTFAFEEYIEIKKKKYQITKELLALSHLPSSPGFTQDIVAIFDSLFNVATLERHKDSISFQHTHKNIKAVKYNIVDSWGIY